VAFPQKANGSIVTVNGQAVGSALIGQQFTAPGYFWGRLSATGPHPYNAAVSSGSNLGPLNPALADAVRRASRRSGPPIRATTIRCRSIW
jgi:K+-transporting ATPase ATPase C chain